MPNALRYIDWEPFQRPKISNRCPESQKDAVFEKNKGLLMKYVKMTDIEVSVDMLRIQNA